MILFVFEGKDDKTYFESFKRLFFPEKLDTFVCTYNSNIYSLYTKLMEHDVLNGALEVDTVSVLKEILLEKADVIISNLSGTYQNDKGEMSVSAKVGISLFPLDGQSYEELYESAIKALYYSKHSVTNGATFAFEGTKPALPIQGTM